MKKHKKLLSRMLRLVSFLVIIVLMHGCATEDEGDGQTFLIGTDTTYAPFEFMDDSGNFVGIDMDLLAAIAEDQGFKYEIQPMGFNAAVQALESQQVDAVMAAMGVTEERAQSFDFSDEYFETDTMFAVRSDSEFENLEDLEGQQVAVKTGTTGAAIAMERQADYGYTVIQFEDSVNMYEDVMVGNSAAAVEDYPVMAFAINTGQVDFRVIGEPLDSVPLGVAVPKGENSDFLEMFNTGLANLRESGEYDEILDRYIGESAENYAVDDSFFGQIKQNLRPLLSGLWATIYLSLISIAIAMVLGIIFGLMRTSENAVLRGIALVYIDAMRGIPLIVLAFFIYFGLSKILGVSFTPAQAGIATLSLNAAAYIAEIVRGGIKAVDKGQREAARSLGLTKGLTMQHVILPQAIKIMIPSLINQFVMTLKDSSILSVIGMVELTQTGRIIIARTYQSGTIWLIVGLMYIILITVLTKLSNHLERRWIS